MAIVKEVLAYTDELLDIASFNNDYCPNGLQVEGGPEINRLVSGVTASLALIEAAVTGNADTMLVHHGYFWKGENPCITGIRRQRIQRLLATRINLIAYHLPLDAHPIYGNNANLGRILGLSARGTFRTGPGPDIGMYGDLIEPMTGPEFAAHIETRLHRKPLYFAGDQKPITTIAWCSGGAQGYLEQAATLGVDAYLTGEVSEQTVHIARETGIHFFAAGHHATERYGVQAMGDHWAERFGLHHQFVDIDNPV